MESPKLLTAASLFFTAAFFCGDAGAAALEWQVPQLKLSASSKVFGQRFSNLPGSQNRFDFQLKQQAALSHWNFNLTPAVWMDVPQPFFDLREGWVEYGGSDFDLRLGNQIISWGMADQTNPTDRWNATDETDPFSPVKLSQLTARLSIHPSDLENVDLEFVVSPFFRKDRFPAQEPEAGIKTVHPSDSRWLLPMPTSMVFNGALIPLSYEMTAATSPSTWQLGTRLRVTRVGSWDLSASFYTGVEKLPRFYVTERGNPSDPSLPITVTLNPSFHRESVFGVDGSGFLGQSSIGLRFEAAYQIRDNARLEALSVTERQQLFRENRVQAVLGIDYHFERTFLGLLDYVNVGYVFDERLGSGESAFRSSYSYQLPVTTPWYRNVVVALERKLFKDSSFRFKGIWDHSREDGYLSPGIFTEWGRGVSTQLGADFFVGSERGFFGQFREAYRYKGAVNYEL